MSNNLFQWEDLRLLLIGAGSAILAAGILRILYLWTSAGAKLIWSYDSKSVSYQNSKNEELSCHFNKLIVQNVGRGTAKNVEIVFSNAPKFFKIQREFSGWFLSNNVLIRDDTNFTVTKESKSSKLIIPALPGKNLVLIIYGTDYSDWGSPQSVTNEGKVAKQITNPVWFLRERDVDFRSLKASWAYWPSVLALIYLLFNSFQQLIKSNPQ